MSEKLSVLAPPATININALLGDYQGCGTIRVIIPHWLMNYERIPGYIFRAFHSSYFVNEWRFYKNFTYVTFQRAATEQHLNLLQHFDVNIKKQTNTPMIYEIDDLLIDIPKWNFAYDYYTSQSENIKKILSIVDGITVSTQKLKDVYSEFNEKIEIIPNHLPKFIWGEAKFKEPKERKPRILWAGSENHFCNKELANKGLKGGDFGNKLINFIRKTVNKYQWVFFGAFPLELEKFIKSGKIEFHTFKNILQYPSYLKGIDADICIASLQQGIFNSCKSNIKMLEYTAIGVPGIYTNIEPYKDAMFTCETEEYMIDRIEELATNYSLRKEVWEHDYKKVEPNLFWENNNNVKKYIDSHLKLFGRRLA
jgi:glycosyltransferase involved in cell wall biosynthesis